MQIREFQLYSGEKNHNCHYLKQFKIEEASKSQALEIVN